VALGKCLMFVFTLLLLLSVSQSGRQAGGQAGRQARVMSCQLESKQYHLRASTSQVQSTQHPLAPAKPHQHPPAVTQASSHRYQRPSAARTYAT
jgi:hypothetical protein